MDIRYQLAEDIASQIGAQLYAGRCPACNHPLLVKPEQGLPFCWFCTTDRIAAQRARTTLLKAKMAENGIFMEEHHALQAPRPNDDDDDDDIRSWPEGMPL